MPIQRTLHLRNVHARYHAHVYSDAATVARARQLCLDAAARFGVAMGRVHERRVGPHQCWSCHLAFDANRFDTIVAWLDAHRLGMSVLVHGLTGDDLADHTTHVAWLGEALATRPVGTGGLFTFTTTTLTTPRRLSMHPVHCRLLITAALLAGCALRPACAQIKIGVTLSTTGPAVSLGIPEKNTITLLPKTIGGKTVDYMVLDDASDTSAAVVNTRRLTLEDKVDAIIGSTTTPNSLAMTDAVAESATPTISLASSARIIEPMSPKKAWVFKTPQTDTMMVLAILEHAAGRGMRTMGYIGFSDALGEAFYAEFEKFASVRGIRIVASERFASRDTSVTAQVIKLTTANPDMVVIGASGTPAVLPARALTERGYKGSVYFNHGVANNDFLRVGGKDIEGAFVPTSPVVVAAALPADHPAKAQAMDYVKRYEAANGAGSVSAFGAYTWDAGLLLSQAIPVALKSAQPGTREFRVALRDALEGVHDLHVSNGVVTMSKNDHLGLDQRARVIVRVEGGKWKLD